MRSRLRLVVWVATGMLVATAAAAQIPSGERHIGKAIIEPGYDDRTGELVFMMAVETAPSQSHADAHPISPLFLVVYPSSAAASVGAMNCAHQGGDNCPDHGPMFSDLARFSMPSVYGSGVWGHDHVIDDPGYSEFDGERRIVVVLFTNAEAANTHITTQVQLDAAIEAGDAFTVATPMVFHCTLVSAAAYDRGTPITSVAP